MSPDRASVGAGGAAGVVPDDFLFGVATAGFQVEGGFNGPGEPANNWLAWEQVGRVEPSGNAVGFWERPEESLDRAAGTRVQQLPDGDRVGPGGPRATGPSTAPPSTATPRSPAACIDRGLEPLVTLHHFTHPAWLGEEFWLRPDAPDRFRDWAELAVDALAPHGPSLRHHQRDQRGRPRVVVARDVPPGPLSSRGPTAALAFDNLLTAHVLAYDVVHRARAGRRRHHQQQLPEHLRVRPHARSTCCSPGAPASHGEDVDEWIAERRRRHDSLPPAAGLARAAAPQGVDAAPPRGSALYGAPSSGRGRGTRPEFPRRGARLGLREPARAHPRRARARLLRPDGRPALPPAGSPDRRGAQPAAHPRALGRPSRPGRASAGGSGSSTTAPRTCRSGWSRTGCATGCATGAPTTGSTAGTDRGTCARTSRRSSRRRDGGVPVTGLLALVARRQLRVGLLRTALRPLRDGPPPRRARPAAGSRPTRWATTRPAPTAGSSPDCGPATGACSSVD